MQRVLLINCIILLILIIIICAFNNSQFTNQLGITNPLTINIGDSSLDSIDNTALAVHVSDSFTKEDYDWATQQAYLTNYLRPPNYGAKDFYNDYFWPCTYGSSGFTLTYSNIHIYQFNMTAVLSDFTQTGNNPYNEMLNIGTLNKVCLARAADFLSSMGVASNPQATKSISPVQSGDTFCLVFDNYFPHWLPWSSGSVFTTIQSGLPGCSQPSTALVTDCGDNNVIDIAKCGSCGTLTFVPNNKIPPNFEVPVLYVNNGITLSMKPNYNGGYLIATLFQNNVTITVLDEQIGDYVDFMKFLRLMKYLPPAGDNYLTRLDTVPGSYVSYVLYYTTLSAPAQGTYQTYVSDSAIIVNGSDTYGPFTINDGNKFSNRHIKLTGGNCKSSDDDPTSLYCTSTKSINFGLDIILPNGTTISIGGKDGDLQDKDFGYLYPFAFIPNCQINFSIWTHGGGYGSGIETFPLNNCLTKNLSRINLSYAYHSGGGDYMRAYADLIDTSGNLIVTKSSGSRSYNDPSGC
jgi:hypothetical protein